MEYPRQNESPRNKSWKPTPCECGHNWYWHFGYDDINGRWIPGGCDHWSGCDCKNFVEKTVDIGERLAS
jgi:hypothetical protein